MYKLTLALFTGIAAGILLAPDKGINTRKQLHHNADSLRGRLRQLLGRQAPDIQDLRAFINQHINGLSEDVRYKLLTILDEAEQMLGTEEPFSMGPYVGKSPL